MPRERINLVMLVALQALPLVGALAVAGWRLLGWAHPPLDSLLASIGPGLALYWGLGYTYLNLASGSSQSFQRGIAALFYGPVIVFGWVILDLIRRLFAASTLERPAQPSPALEYATIMLGLIILLVALVTVIDAWRLARHHNTLVAPEAGT